MTEMDIQGDKRDLAQRLRKQAGSTMTEAKELAARLQAEAARLDAEVDAAKLMQGFRPATDADRLASRLAQLPNSTILMFDKQWGTGNGSRVYRYAAVKDDTSLWNTTGPKSPKKYSDREFAMWLSGIAAGSGQACKVICTALRGFYVWGQTPDRVRAMALPVTTDHAAVYDDRA